MFSCILSADVDTITILFADVDTITILFADVDTITILQNKSKNITSSFITVPTDAPKNIKKLQKLL